MSPLEQKTARLTVLIDPAKKKAFESLCAAQDVTPSQVVRKMVRDYLRQHGVQWTPGEMADDGMASDTPLPP
ncbi:MAG: CopG family transcriptional regulator [Pseudomonadota bacterium]|nr:CopG family transcriptional regulator [Pseudomonadota bacterium]